MNWERNKWEFLEPSIALDQSPHIRRSYSSFSSFQFPKDSSRVSYAACYCVQLRTRKCCPCYFHLSAKKCLRVVLSLLSYLRVTSHQFYTKRIRKSQAADSFLGMIVIGFIWHICIFWTLSEDSWFDFLFSEKLALLWKTLMKTKIYKKYLKIYFLCISMQFIALSHLSKDPKRGLPTNRRRISYGTG